MNKFAKTLSVFTAILLTSGMVPASAAEDEGFFSYWGINSYYGRTHLSGSTHVKDSSAARIDIKDQLGLSDEHQSFISPTFNILKILPPSFLQAMKKWSFRLESYEFSGDSQVADGFRYNSIDFTAGDPLHSELDIDRFRLMYMTDFDMVSNTNFTWLAEFRRTAVKNKLDVDGLTPAHSHQSFQKYFVGLGARLETGRRERNGVYAEISGQPGKSYFFDAETGFIHRISKNTTLVVGYRTSNEKITEAGADIRYTMSGPFLEASHSF